MFSFAIDISDDEGKEASSSITLGIASAEIKSKLEDLLALLQQDTAQLVDDSDPAKAIFKILHGQIPADAEEILFQATRLESHQFQYEKAIQRLADRAAYAQLNEDMVQVKHAADEKHKNINILQSSGVELKQRISNLSAKREALRAELKQVEEALTQLNRRKANYPMRSRIFSKKEISKLVRCCK